MHQVELMDFPGELKEKLSQLKSLASREGKRTVLCFASTKNVTTPDKYFTAFRHSDRAVSLCLMIQSTETLESIVSEVDGHVDFVLVDNEIKFADLSDMSDFALKNIRNTPVIFFPGNKITSLSVYACLQQEKKIIPGANVLIVGAGHLGIRIALDLADAGCNVWIKSRNEEKLRNLCNGVNLLKLDSSPGRTEVFHSSCNIQFDVIMGCANEAGVISSELVLMGKKKCFYLDVGLGNFSQDALHLLHERGELVRMTNIARVYNSHIDDLIDQSAEKLGKSIINGVCVYSAGILAPRGAVVVDQLNSPKTVYGVSSGNGTLLKGEEEKPYLSDIEKVRNSIEDI